MTEVNYPVDHMRLNYQGPFDAKELYRLVTSFWREKGYDFHPHKEFEHQTSDGIQIDWVLKPWKQMASEYRNMIKMRFIISDYKKVDAVIQKKKIKVGTGKIEVFLDGYYSLDQWSVWESGAMLQFIRALYVKFVYRIYTERFEQRLTYDMHHLYDMLEKFFNIYRHYRVVSKPAPFDAHTA